MTTKKDLVDLIKKHKKTNCPAYSNKKKDELIKIVNNLNLKETVKETVKKPKVKKTVKKPKVKETVKKPKVKKPLTKLKKIEETFIKSKYNIKKKLDKILNDKNYNKFSKASNDKIELLEEELSNIIQNEKEYYQKKLG